MADETKPAPYSLNEGHVPAQKGWKPTVQGGYKPAASQVVSAPPTGGSAIRPADPVKG